MNFKKLEEMLTVGLTSKHPPHPASNNFNKNLCVLFNQQGGENQTKKVNLPQPQLHPSVE